MKSKKLLLNKKLIFVVFLIFSFILSSWLATVCSIYTVEKEVPGFFYVVVQTSSNEVSMQKFNEINSISSSATFFISEEKLDIFRQKLKEQYTGSRGTWSFDIISQDVNKQYIHVIATGDDDIIESWYWVTDNQIKPDKFRWLNPGVIWIVLPLTIFFSIGGFLIYSVFRKKFLVL